MRERIRGVMATVFAVSVEDLPGNASPDSFPPWDSLRQLELMLALEAEFGVRIPTDQMLSLLSVDRIEAFLKASGCSNAAAP